MPGAVDVYLQQRLAAPTLFIDVDRTRAAGLSLTEREVGNDLLVSLASTGQAAPNFWLNPQNGVQYVVSVQTPQFRMASLEEVGQHARCSGGGRRLAATARQCGAHLAARAARRW